MRYRTSPFTLLPLQRRTELANSRYNLNSCDCPPRDGACREDMCALPRDPGRRLRSVPVCRPTGDPFGGPGYLLGPSLEAFAFPSLSLNGNTCPPALTREGPGHIHRGMSRLQSRGHGHGVCQAANKSCMLTSSIPCVYVRAAQRNGPRPQCSGSVTAQQPCRLYRRTAFLPGNAHGAPAGGVQRPALSGHQRRPQAAADGTSSRGARHTRG